MKRSRLAGRLLRVLGRLVPRDEREEWLMEWDAELEHVADLRAGGARAPGGTIGRLVAAGEDALRIGLTRLRRGLPTVLGRDVRFAGRALARSPLFTAAVVVALALGIGANAAVFTVVDAVLLKPLPYPDSDRLVQLVWKKDERVATGISTADFDDLRERAGTIEQLSLRVPTSLTYQAERPVVLAGASVSAGYFGLFGTTSTWRPVPRGGCRCSVGSRRGLRSKVPRPSCACSRRILPGPIRIPMPGEPSAWLRFRSGSAIQSGLPFSCS